MKRLTAFIMVLLTAVSVGGLIFYNIHKNIVGGGASPEIRFDQEKIELPANAGDAQLLQGVAASDAEDGDLTSAVMVENVSRFVDDATVEVTYVVYDSQNHLARAKRTVQYSDYHSPQFTMGAPMVFSTRNIVDIVEDVGADDVIDGDLSLKVHASFDDTASTLSSVGEHTVTFVVTNSRGDTARLPVSVKVVEDSVHSERIPLKTYLLYLDKGSKFDPRSFLMDTSQQDSDEIEVDSPVNTNKPGVYAVDFQLVKNTEAVAMTRLIVVVE